MQISGYVLNADVRVCDQCRHQGMCWMQTLRVWNAGVGKHKLRACKAVSPAARHKTASAAEDERNSRKWPVSWPPLDIKNPVNKGMGESAGVMTDTSVKAAKREVVKQLSTTWLNSPNQDQTWQPHAPRHSTWKSWEKVPRWVSRPASTLTSFLRSVVQYPGDWWCCTMIWVWLQRSDECNFPPLTATDTSRPQPPSSDCSWHLSSSATLLWLQLTLLALSHPFFFKLQLTPLVLNYPPSFDCSRHFSPSATLYFLIAADTSRPQLPSLLWLQLTPLALSHPPLIAADYHWRELPQV